MKLLICENFQIERSIYIILLLCQSNSRMPSFLISSNRIYILACALTLFKDLNDEDKIEEDEDVGRSEILKMRTETIACINFRLKKWGGLAYTFVEKLESNRNVCNTREHPML